MKKVIGIGEYEGRLYKVKVKLWDEYTPLETGKITIKRITDKQRDILIEKEVPNLSYLVVKYREEQKEWIKNRGSKVKEKIDTSKIEEVSIATPGIKFPKIHWWNKIISWVISLFK